MCSTVGFAPADLLEYPTHKNYFVDLYHLFIHIVVLQVLVPHELVNRFASPGLALYVYCSIVANYVGYMLGEACLNVADKVYSF